MEFFTSDLHIGHEGIIKVCNRPYTSVNHMNKAFLDNWNTVVTPDDTVYIVGDFFWGDAINKPTFSNYLKRLNGRKILVAGNHELDKLFFYAGDQGVGFDQIAYPFLEIHEFILCHDPSAGIVFPDRPFITGHVHHQWHILNNCFNCGVDVNNYTPVSITFIRKHFKEWEQCKK